MTSVSIIHAPRDEALGEKIAAALASAGHAARRLSAEPGVPESAAEARGEDGAAIVVWTEAAAKLARLHQQAGAAMARGALVPVAVGGARPPWGFEELTPVDLSGWTGAPDDPRWRFVLEEIQLAKQRALLKDGDVWASAGETGPGEEDAVFYAEEFDEGDEPEIVAAPPAFLARPQRSGLSRRFSAREVAVGASAGLVLMTAATWILAPTILPGVDRHLAERAPAGAETAPDDADAVPDPSAASPSALASLQAAPPAEEAAEETAAPASEDDAIAALIESEAPDAERPLTLSPEAASRSGPLTQDAADAVGTTELQAGETQTAQASGEDAMRDLIASLDTDMESAEAQSAAPEAASETMPAGTGNGDYFRDCADCPEMASLPAGSFRMGAAQGAGARDSAESPVLSVALSKPFALAAHETTYAQWDRCVADGACAAAPDFGWGRGERPVVGVSHADAADYAAWLAEKTGQPYRLPSEAEWEYAARAGGDSAFAFGPTISVAQANFNGEYPYGREAETFRGRTTPAASFPPNAFGLYDMHGNAWEWTADCWKPTHAGAPQDGSAAAGGDCAKRVLKGGAWNTGGWRLRSAHRIGKRETAREFDNGFRVARDL